MSAEIVLKKIRDYKLQDEAFEQKGVKPEWKKQRHLPPVYFQRYVKSIIDKNFNDIEA